MAQQPPTFVLEDADGVRVAVVQGEIDVAIAVDFEQAMIRALEGTDLLVDLSRCSFLDSSAVAALVAAARAADERGRWLAVVAPAGPVSRVLEISGIPGRLPTFAARDEALSSR